MHAAQLWWRGVDYAYAAAWQVRAAVSRARPETFVSGRERPVLILPGVYEPWRFMLPLIRELHAAGHPVHVVPELGRNEAAVASGASVVDAYLRRAELRDVVIVAHSKGGLLGKQVMAFGEAGERIRAMLAIATPFGGSRYATYMVSRTLRSFSPRNEALVTLGNSLEANGRIVSVFPAFDPHIPEGSALVGARNVELATAGHFRVLADPAVRELAAQVAAGYLPENA